MAEKNNTKVDDTVKVDETVKVDDTVKAENITLAKNELNIDGINIKIDGLTLKGFQVANTLSEETRDKVKNDLLNLYQSIRNATKGKVAIGKALDDIRTHKTLSHLTYKENGKVKTIGENATFDACAKIFKYSATTLKEAYIIYTTFYKPCTDNTLPITEINGYSVDSYNDTQLLQIAYALSADNSKGLQGFNNTLINPLLTVKETKKECEKVANKPKKGDKGNDGNKDDKPKDTPLEKMPIKEFLYAIGNLIADRMKTVGATKNPDLYKYLLDAHKTLGNASLIVANDEKAENSENSENK